MLTTSFALHPAQQEVYTDQLLNINSPLYNIGGYIVLKGDLDKAKLHKTINSAPKVLDFFKLRFNFTEPDFLCHYDEEYDAFTLTEIDFSGEENPQDRATSWAQDRFNTPFVLSKESLPFEQCLLKISDSEHWFFGKYHHLITDGYGFIVWIQYIASKYHFLVEDDDLNFTYPHYRDEVIKASQYLNSSAYDADAAYWKEKIPNKPEKLLQKKYHPKPEINNTTSIYTLQLANNKRQSFEELQLNTKSSLQQLTLAALLIYFGKITSGSEFIFGVPIHKRGSRVLRNIVGMFSGILPFKGNFDEEKILIDLLSDIGNIQRADYRHQNFPIGDLSRHLKINNSEGYLYDVLVNYEPLNFELNFGGNINASIVRLANEDERNPLQFAWRDYGVQQPLELHVHFANEYFSKEDIELLAKRIIYIIEQFTSALHQNIGNIKILTEEEAGQLSTFNITETNYPREKSIVDLFNEQVLERPESIAIVFRQKVLTYAELDKRSNQLAHYLQNKGVESDMLVPLCQERGIEMIISILAILKAGGAYVPLDPSYPDERLIFMLEDTGASVVISSKANRARFESSPGILIIEPDGDDAVSISTDLVSALNHQAAADQLAYVIYTSGSTGQPKGVLVEHGNVVSLIKEAEYVKLCEADTLLVTGSPSFDATTFEYWGMLLNGGRLILCSEEELLDSIQLKQLIRDNQVTTMWFTSSWFNQLIDTDSTIFEGLGTILVGGEQLSVEHIRKFRQHYRATRLINGYGPTENTTFSVTYEIEDLAEINSIPIGRPLSNRQAYVLNSNQELLPIGVAGEIYLGGAGLSRGYLNRPELTAEKFISNSFSQEAGSRLYKTGDLGRWLPDGNLEYLGRLDEQVKIRGYRIEPGEIENVLLQSGLVNQAVVAARPDGRGSKRLVGYVVATGYGFNKEQVQSYLAERLPEYMVPTLWMELENIPLTTNGKTDKGALPDLDINEQLSHGYIAPQTELDKKLAKIWQELLNVEQVGTQDNFFELGGDSIVAIQLVSRIRRLGYELQPRDIFAQQTISRQSEFLASQSGILISGEQGLLTGYCGLLPIQHWYLQKNPQSASHFNQSILLTIDKKVTEQTLQEAIEQLSIQHDALRFRYAETGNGWEQIYGSYIGQVITEHLNTAAVDLNDEICKKANEHQQSLDIEQGKLIRVVLMHTSDSETHNRLLIVIHHLAIDGVSWRILLEDLEEFLLDSLSNRTIHASVKGSSYRQWYEALYQYSLGDRLLSQRDYWEKIVKGYQPLPVDKTTNEKFLLKHERQQTVKLDTEQTRRLLQEVPKVYHTEINDVLLTALALTMTELIGSKKLTIGLEGHGRENISEGIDSSRTVGWFTSLYPVILETSEETETSNLINKIKEQLRQLPDKGLGYGVLKYINKEESLQGDDPWDITYNYLGQLDNVLDKSSLLGMAQEESGSALSDDQVKTTKISIETYIKKGELVVRWNFSSLHYHAETIANLAETYHNNLVKLIEDCSGQAQGTSLNSTDYGLSPEVSDEELDRFVNEPFKEKRRKDQLENIYRLSSLQEGMLFHGLYSSGSGAYISQFTLDLYQVNPVHFRKSWEHVLQSHSILRSAFYHNTLSIPVQCVYRQVDLEIITLDYRDLTDTERTSAIKEFIKTDSSRGFNFEEAPLTRFALIQLTEDKYKMIWSTHHIIFDGWSLPVLIEEFLNNYELLARGSELPVKKIDDYGDYIRYLQRVDKADQERYWRKYLTGVEKTTLLPFIKNQTERTKGIGSYESLTIQPDAITIKEIRAYAQKNHITVNTLMQGIWAYLLYFYTRNEHVQYAVTVSGRPDDLPDVEQRVGMYINTLPLHSHIEKNKSIVEWLKHLQGDQLASRQYQHTPINDIQAWTGIKGDFFDSLLVFLNYPVNKLVSEKKWLLQVDNLYMYEQNNFPLTITIGSTGDLSIVFTYNTELLKEENIKQIRSHFESLLSQIINKPEGKLSDIELLSHSEANELLNVFNNSQPDVPKENSIIDLFRHQASKVQDDIAIVFEQEQLSYRELDEQSNRLAHYLQSKSVNKETLVPLCLERGPQVLIAILGVLKAGGAFVPIDPGYPEERISYMLQDTRATLVLSSKAGRNKLRSNSSVNIIELDGTDKEAISNLPSTNLLNYITPDQLAYVIYTSGSTGQPKGVMIEHRGLMNYLVNSKTRYTTESEGNSGSFVHLSYTFDASLTALFMPLLGGKLIVIASTQIINVFEDPNLWKYAPYDFIKLTPVHLSLLQDAVPDTNRRRLTSKLVVGGEALLLSHFDNYLEKGLDSEVVNEYGPTEATVGCSTYSFNISGNNERIKDSIPIGKPLDNTNLYVLGDKNELLPVGIAGELYIGGPQVARGYLNRPDLTSEKFISNPFSGEAGSRLYKTGDLARWLANGNLEYLGRIDDQVKVRGYRIELGEIESVLHQHAKVKQAVVLAREDSSGNKRLIGYVVPADEFDKEAIQAFLESKLPEYMVPSVWVELDKLPVTSNGKIDRKALPDPDMIGQAGAAYTAPRNETEEKLAEIWQGLLEIDEIGINDDFFDLGGHSLLAIRLISSIRRELGIELSINEVFDYPTIALLAEKIKSETETELLPSINIVSPRPLRVPLSFSQERLWFIDQLEGSLQYHITAVIRLRGELDSAGLEYSLREIVNRHEILRTVYHEDLGRAYQEIKPAGKWSLQVTDGIIYQKDAETLQKYIALQAHVPFDLSKDDMLRAELIVLSEVEHVLLVTMHHIASDAWSMPILVREVAELYRSYIEKRAANLSALPLQYADYAIWQKGYLSEEVIESKLNYWKAKLDGITPLQLPTDYSRPAEMSTRGASVEFVIPQELSKRLLDLSKGQGATLYMTLLAAFKVMLYRYSGQEDIAVGTSIAGRPQQELEGLIGFFVNTLSLRSELRAEMTFAELLAEVRVTMLEAYMHQEVPFERVVDAVVKERDASRSPLFQVMLVLRNTPEVPQLELGDLVLTGEPYEHTTVKFDLTFFLTETANGLEGSVLYSTDLFHSERIERMVKHFTTLLNSIVSFPQERIGKLRMLGNTEEAELSAGFNVSYLQSQQEKALIELFEEQAEKSPDTIALAFGREQLPFSDLNSRSNQVAHYLKSKGVKADTMVPLFIDRSLEMIIGLLGILKAGGAYVPIDTDFPEDRIRFMLEDTGADLILSSAVSRKKLFDQGNMEVIELGGDWSLFNDMSANNLSESITPEQLLYVIYTSGSTGQPKGVLVDHGNMLDYVQGLNERTDINACRSYALVSTMATDLGNTVLYSWLVSGGTLHIFSKEMVSHIEDLHAYFGRHHIECLKIVPSHWKALLNEGKPLLPVRLLVFGGEALQGDVVKTIKEAGASCRVVNHYGPTETTVGKLLHEVDLEKAYGITVPIGKPFSTTKIYVLSKDGSLCPIGVPGELHIGGDGVAQGYLNNLELTTEKFLADPFDKTAASRIYRTGDLVSYNNDGNIIFLGRVDDQVKIRGYRVEPGEIGRMLEGSGLVRQAVVIANDDHQGNKQLVGYVVPVNDFDREGILEYSREMLPEYMIPTHIVELESIPLTANGKVDRKALPSIESNMNPAGEYVAPRTSIEAQLTEIWKDVLEVDEVGVHDDFFELGGHSLLAVRLISAVRKAFKAELPIGDIFDYPTVALLAERLDNQSEDESTTEVLPTIGLKERPQRIPLSFSQERLWFIDRMEGSVQYHVPAVLQLKGELDKDALSYALEEIVKRHEVLRTVIKEENGDAYQVIQQSWKAVTTLVDGNSYVKDRQGLEEYIRELIRAPFRLSEDNMLRAHLITLGANEHVLVVVLHHIASDGWSRSVLVSELVELYASFVEQRPTDLPILPVQYVDYAIWQREYLQGEVLESKLSYWKRKLQNVSPLELPTDHTRPAIQSTRGALTLFDVPTALTKDLLRLSQGHGATLYMTLLSAFKVLLHRYSGQEDICVGTGIAGRQQQEFEGLIGFFVNTLAMRSHVDQELRFTELLEQVKATTLEAYAHQEVPFEKVVEAVVTERDMSRNPLFQVTFVVQNTPDVPELKLGDVALSVQNYDHVTTKFDITFSITETESGLQGIVEYNTDLFEGSTIERMTVHFVELLKSIVVSPNQKISSLSMLSHAEEALFEELDATKVSYPGDKSLVLLFEEQATKTPEALALVFNEQKLTYQELNAQSNRLAHYLQSNGLKAEQLVPICLERGIQMIVIILGILKAGGTYVPIDPEYPQERIRFMLEDTAAELIVTTKASRHHLGDTAGIKVIETDGADAAAISTQSPQNPVTQISPDQLVYVIYTSGSTGKPKGVLVEHGSVVNLIYAQSAYFNITSQERILQFSNYSFDASVEQIFLALSNGATLILFPEGLQYDTAQFEAFLKEQQVSHLHATPFFLENITADDYPNLKRVIAGGDVCRKELAAKWKDKVDFYNEYGPTETTVTAIEYHDSGTEEGRNVPIGKALPNVSLYILDQHQSLCPQGVPGELYIGGIQVARGYLNRPELTRERFIASPFNHETGERLYRTGDLARWLSDGNVEYLGRIDDQVKVRGYRIELGEIESVLNELEPVENSCVVVKHDTNASSRLVGYYVPKIEVLKKKEHELYIQQIESWKEIHENEYVLAEEEEIEDPEFNILGWNNSFTRKAIAAEQMREWLDDITAVILAENPEQVLEIGCGTGLIYYQLAGKIKKYIGTDFSRHSINQIRERIDKCLRDYGPTELEVCAAHEISLKQSEQPDTIIINSVVQYFPGGDYLSTVIEKSISLLKGQGRIIIGDIRDNRTLSLFKSRLHLSKIQEPLSLDEFKWAVEQEVLKEEELCFSPEYFYTLQLLHPQITHIDIQWKQGSYINELSQYRFTAIIHVGVEKDILKPQWQNWDTEKWSLLSDIKAGKNILAIKDAPNPRLWQEKQLLNALESNSISTTKELVQAMETRDNESIEVEEIINTAILNGYQCRLFLDEDPLKINLLLEKQPSNSFIESVYSSKIKTSGLTTNIPLFADISLLLQKEIRSLLQLRLPDYMVPSEFTALMNLPINSNGKVDRKFLSRTENRIISDKLNYQPPRNETEQTLARIWQELLNIEAGIHDNFFELGGHSLLGMRVIASIRRELNTELSIKDLFVNPTISELAEHLRSQQKKSLLPALVKELRSEYVPLSFGQERLWFIDQLEGSIQYHIPVILKLQGILNKEALIFALQQVINRHEVLRTVIRQQEGQGYQHLLQPDSWNLTEIDNWNGRNDAEALQDYIEQLIVEPFDLSTDHMLRAHLIKLGEREYVLLVTMHHISSDGWSTSIIVKELVELYESYLENRPVRLDNLEVQYADFAIWQRKYLQGEVLDKKVSYWKQKLDGVAPLQLPSDYPRPSVWIPTGAITPLQIEKPLLEKLHALSRQHGSTLFMTLVSAFKVLMYRYSGQQDICIGTSIAGRQQKETEDLIGFFINILALRSNIDGDASFSDLLNSVKVTTLEAYEHQEVPFEKVVEAVAKDRDMSRNPVCQVMFVLQNTPEVPELRLGDLILSREGYEQSTAQYDMIVRITETSEGLQGAVQYSTALYKEATVERIMDNFKVLLESIVKQPEQKVSGLRILTNKEEQTLLEEFNATKADYPTNKSILDLFKEQVSVRGESLALLFEEQYISYAELEKRSNQLAHLLKTKGVTDGTLVPICIERSVEMIVGILGILKAGGAYVPIDPDYPHERISYMLEDIGANLIISNEVVKEKLENLSVSDIIELDGEDRRQIRMQPATDLEPIDPSQLAYVIYTSGSTGRPKGVMVEHHSVVNLALSQAEALRLKPGMRTLQFASFGFDASCYEIFNTLLSGGCLVLCSKEDLLSADGLKNLINRHQIEVAVLPPSYQNIIVDSLGTLKTIVSAGEPLNEGIGRRIQAQNVRLVNAYGPTENTVCVSLTDTPIREDGVIVIGKPIANVQVYILDAANGLSPLGSTGELCVSGVQVARGYLNRQELTAEKFIANPFNKRSKLYKTGDLAKWLPDGNIEYLGRIDEQVKIRGYRIELGEIESVLQQSGLVNQAVVLAKEDTEGHKRLVAYVQTDGDFDKEELQTYLLTKLPEYMVPALWVHVDSFSLTSSGKIDRKALPDPDAAQATNEYAAPRNELEQKLVEIWQDLLDIEQIGINDNFFELGGDSILTIQVVSRMRRFGYEFEVNDMFTYQTISELSQVIASKSAEAITAEQGLLTGPAGLLPIQQWYFEKQPEAVSHYNQSVLLSVNKAVTSDVLSEAVAQLALQHDALRFKYTHNSEEWEQEYGTEQAELLIDDLRSEIVISEQITKYADKHQRSLDIEQGKLIRIVLMQTPETETHNRLFIVIHHLAIDGVSWRIILEDLKHLLDHLQKGIKPEAGIKSSSYRQWYNALVQYGQSHTLLSQKSYWEQAVKAYKPLPEDKTYIEKLLVKDLAHYKIHLDAEQTRRLLQEVPKVYHTEINDILLTALSMMLSKWSGYDKSVIGLEGHGREHIAEGIDTSRTVGWFTTLYPVVLETRAELYIANSIKSVKEQLRQIPDKGLGYGVLKYIQKEASLQGKEPWDMVFNYLGQLDAVGIDSNLLKRADEFAGAGMSDLQPASSKLSINSYIKGGELTINWTYSIKHYDEETIIKLAGEYIENLKNLIVHCMEQEPTTVGYTPSDYGLGSDIKYEELDKFLEDEDDEDNIMSF